MATSILSTGSQPVYAAAGGNVYGKAFVSSVKQSLVPVLLQTGELLGYYAISTYTFTGTETKLVLPDNTVPLTTVTRATNPTHASKVLQFMAAVFPIGLAAVHKPWSSTSFIPLSPGLFRTHNMTGEGSSESTNLGVTLNALASNMNLTLPSATAATAPSVTTTASLTWTASVKYSALNGNNSFFDFNWQTVFNSQSSDVGQSIVVNSSNAAFIATVLPTPVVQALPNGGSTQVYNTIRILRVADVTPGVYPFTFTIYSVNGLSTAVTLNLTIL
jgi:hypothetical protein